MHGTCSNHLVAKSSHLPVRRSFTCLQRPQEPEPRKATEGMASRIPVAADFPSSLSLTITPPPTHSPQPTNILILLHGFGDTNKSFTSLAQQLQLPETTCISLQAPNPLGLDLPGFHWGDDILFDSSTEDMDPDCGFTKASAVIGKTIIQDVLRGKCAYQLDKILILGYGQGASAALAAASSLSISLGGIISIGGPLPVSNPQPKLSSKSPVLLLGGSSDSIITQQALINLRDAFASVEYHKWKRAGDHMPRSTDEMMPIMRFLARKVKSSKGVPAGSVEIG